MKKILVSECLYGGRAVRYDGKNIPLTDKRFAGWKEEGRLVPICPEVFGGLPVPRADAQRVDDKVIARDGTDITQEYICGAKEALRLAQENSAAFAIMKQSSPSCGSRTIYDGSFTGQKISGQGVAAEMLRNAGFVVLSEDDLDEAEQMLARIIKEGGRQDG
ncbi:DUF523 domain-containing protein [Parasporobacterium paucivorans]|uniref:Uncharacterized conserved protein YbbK, DUF523 family n=1 Tax=Parasporobacterium paucivorans DSM 15970 TaxID=1122934 RepID=A0A1M6GYF2_9FIRM|nr:DUF523 domain-containing protein [Parasporobacterium paucivorans]SHJ14993.1 Uncharacterized conserved protein YbbK, DUF523 family [Parasporobacterium paucivorans DSM 15970]